MQNAPKNRVASTPDEITQHMQAILTELGDVPVMLQVPKSSMSGMIQDRASVWANKPPQDLQKILSSYPGQTAEIIPLFV